MSAIITSDNKGRQLHFQQLASTKQEELQKVSGEISSGRRVSDFNELGAPKQYLTDVSTRSIIEERGKAMQTLKHSLGEVEAVIKTVLDINGKAIVLWNSSYGNPTTHEVRDIENEVESMLESVGEVLNKRFNSHYLFAGNRADVKPVDIDLTSPNIDAAGNVTDEYYDGDKQTRKEEIADSRVLEYGIRADDPAFQEFIGALFYMQRGAQQLRAGNTAAADAAFNEANELLYSSKTNLSSLLQDVGGYNNILEDQMTRDEDFKLSLDERINEAVATDIIEATARFSAIQVQVQAAYHVLARASTLSIVDYIT